jgi:pentatricopeptide repeat protein
MSTSQPLRVGVVGLLADPQSANAFVTPLVAELASEWIVAPNLPFSATELQIALQKVLECSPLPELLPEFFAFRIVDRLGQKSYGQSMTVSGVMAILDASTDFRCPLLSTAVSLVEPSEHNGLRPVAHVTQKLRAFAREHGSGTLLVRSRRCLEAGNFDHLFGDVWLVDSWAELAQKFEQHGLLAGFHQRSELDRHKLRIAIERLSVLCTKHVRFQEALTLAEKLNTHPVGQDVTSDDRKQVRQWIIDLYRHLGRYREACEHSRAQYKRLRTEDVDSSYDQQALAAAVYAASLYDLHRFSHMVRVLTPWCRELRKNAFLVAPLTRVAVFNTLARAQVAMEATGWESLYESSLEILSAVDPFDRARTYNYLLHGLLRAKQLDEAEMVVKTILDLPSMSKFSRWMLGFFRADLARRKATTWSDSALDTEAYSAEVAGHALGYYLQATARQPGRSQHDATLRFQRAQALFLRDVCPGDTHNVLLFLASCMDLALAAQKNDHTSWRTAVRSLAEYVERQSTGGFRDHYRPVLPKHESTPSIAVAEALLHRVPYL